MDEARRAEDFFHQHIPLTRAMGLRVVAQENGFAVEAPVSQNSNHLQTGFGGSINALATLAAYGLIWSALAEDPQVHVVIVESSIRYLRPFRQTIRAVCSVPQDGLEGLKSELKSRGRTRIELKVRVQENEETGAEFAGVFLATRGSRER